MAQADAPELPPEFFTNVIKELRRHWVDREARRLGLDPDSVTRALVLGNTGDAEVRVNDRVRAAVFVGDDQIIDLNEAAQLVGERGDTLQIRGLVLDVPPDQPFAFFDLRVGYLLFDYQPRRVATGRRDGSRRDVGAALRPVSTGSRTGDRPLAGDDASLC